MKRFYIFLVVAVLVSSAMGQQQQTANAAEAALEQRMRDLEDRIIQLEGELRQLKTQQLKPGESTDGAVFFENRSKEKSLGPGRLIAKTCGETFIFEVYPEIKLR